MAQKLGMCDALDMNGRRCRRQAVTVDQYHGNSEIYNATGDQPSWVRVEFCAVHAEPKPKRKARKA